MVSEVRTLNIARSGRLATAETAIPNKSLGGLESHARSLIKALSYRAAGFIVTGSVVWVITSEVIFAATVAVADAVLKIGLYYLHERVWDRFNFGRRGA